MYLGFDLGTTNVKAVVADDRGQVVAVGSAPVDRFCTPDGGVEQDIEQIWQATRSAVGQAVQGLDAARIRAIGVSSQGGAVQLLDARDAPQGRVISWLDQRGRPYDEALTAELGREFLAGHIGHGTSAMTIGQVLRLRRQSPERIKPPHRIGFVGDVIVGRLCGRRAHDATSLAIAMLYNPWLGRPDPEVMTRLGLRDEQLPCLLPATTAAGVLQPSAAEAIGLRSGIPVSPAIHDQYAASLGAASVEVGDVNFGAGTAWVLLANAGELTPPAVPEAFVCPHPVAGLYGQMLSMTNGGSAIDWAMNLLGEPAPVARRVDDALGATSPGAEGLRFWPFLSHGPCVGGCGTMTGRLSGITLAHAPDHLIRAVVEGLACELLRHIGLLTAAGVPVHRLAMCGGAAGGRGAPQIIADVARLPVSCVETPDVSALGAAMLARSLVDSGSTLGEIARQWTPARRMVAPSEQAGLYDKVREEYSSIFRSIPVA
jgi:sugar (pentulose or hexulose) kinase